MLGWAIGFFVAALVAAIFGFGGIASAFTGIAMLLFWVFLGLFALSLVLGLFRGGAAHADGHGHVSRSGGTFATVALIAGVAIVTYAWMKNDMSAEKLGRNVDETAATLAENVTEGVQEAGNRVETATENVADDVREGTADTLDEAGNRVDPDTADSDRK